MLDLNLNYQKYNIVPNEKGKILCRIRNKEVKFNPEEMVRQGLIHYLIEEMHVPENMIEVEYSIDRENSADIVVFYTDKEAKEDYSLLLIECKAECVNLNYTRSDIYEQIGRYQRQLNSQYVAYTNGRHIEIVGNVLNFGFLSKVPSYQGMLAGQVEIIPEITESLEFTSNRCPIDKITDLNFLEENYSYIIGGETPDILKPFLVNFNDALEDDNLKIEPCRFNNFELLEDFGIENKSYGTPVGGVYEGPYRKFIINDFKGNTLAINFLLTASFRKEYLEYRMDSPYLVVGVDGDNLKHSCLQIGINKSVKKVNSQYIITHNGRTTVGRGSVSSEDLKSYLSENNPQLFNPEDLRLGVIKNNEPLSMKNLEMKHFILATIEYTMLRYYFKKQYRK